MGVLHDWDNSDARRILTAVRRAASMGRRVFVIEAMRVAESVQPARCERPAAPTAFGRPPATDM